MNRALLALLLLACVSVVSSVVFTVSQPALAQSIGGGGGGGGIFNGGTITGGIVTSGVASDLSTPANEDLSLTSGGTGAIYLYGGSTTNGLRVTTGEASGYALLGLYTPTIGSVLLANPGVAVGAGYATEVGVVTFSAARDVTLTTQTPMFSVYGRGTLRSVPNNALTIGNPTDTTSTPLGSGTTGAGTACRMSAAGAAAWTPSETAAVDGMFWCCTNTGANAITMTDSDGVYEGPGSVVGQWDQVCMEYVTDRFIERSFSNNEP